MSNSVKNFTGIRHFMSREAILGHESSWQISDFGMAQRRHGYDPGLLETIRQRAVQLKREHAHRKHLNLTFITGADRFIPEIKELMHDQRRLDRLSDLAGARLEPYPLSIVGATVTFMGPNDGAVDWHCDGVPVTELVPLSISDPIVGGELEIFLGNSESGRARADRGENIPRSELLTVQHKMGYSTIGQFVGVLHRTRPIEYGDRVTLVLNQRSVERPFIDDNRMFYLAADNDLGREWVNEMAEDVWSHQLPAYRRAEAAREAVCEAASHPAGEDSEAAPILFPKKNVALP